MASGPPLIYGNLGRDRPHSWLLVRARDGRTLATSDSAGGALKTAHSFWPKLDASDLRPDGLRIIRDRDGAVVAAVVHTKRQESGVAELRAEADVAKRADPRILSTTEAPMSEPKAKRPAKPRAKTIDSSERGLPLHIILPKSMHSEIDRTRENIAHAVGVLPTTATVVRAALELGLKSLSERVAR